MTGLATVTLARLYVQQGHFGRARVMLERVLERAPDNGEARVLARRLEIRERATLSLEVAEDNTALLRWSGLPVTLGELGELGGEFEDRRRRAEAELHAILIVFGRGPGHAIYSTSRRCTRARGELVLPCGPRPGSASACVAARLPGDSGTLRPVAVAPAITWA